MSNIDTSSYLENSYLTSYTGDAATASANKVSDQIKNASTNEEALEACKEFEAYMIQQIYKNMEEAAKVLTEDDEEKDSTTSGYMDMFSDTYLQDLTKNMMANGQGIGLAEKLYKSMVDNGTIKEE